MLRDAHRGLEMMSSVASAIKEERWVDAERSLQDLQQLMTGLMRAVGDKQREQMMAPKPDRGERGSRPGHLRPSRPGPRCSVKVCASRPPPKSLQDLRQTGAASPLGFPARPHYVGARYAGGWRRLPAP